MADVDTSFYKQPSQPSALDTIGKLQGLEQQQLGIQRQSLGVDQDKLKLMNDRFGVITKEFTSLMNDPELSVAKVHETADNMVKMGLVPPESMAAFRNQLPTNPDQLRNFVRQQILRAQTINDAVNFAHGIPGTLNTGSHIIPTLSSPDPAFGGIRRTGPGLPVGIPPTAEEWKPGGSARRGTVPLEEGDMPPMAPGFPGEGRLPIAPAEAPRSTLGLPPGERPMDDVKPAAARRESPTGPPARYTIGLEQFTEDSKKAEPTLASTIPAVQALKLMNGLDLKTGSGTQKFNDFMAFAKNWIPGFEVQATKDGKYDSTVAYQIVNKKLADYLRSGPLAGSTDAGRLMDAAASPDPKGQLNEALIKLTKDDVALRRLASLRAITFKDREDFDKYIDHRTKFRSTFDERVLSIDHMDDRERYELTEEMRKKLNGTEREKNEAKKFVDSYEKAKAVGIFDFTGFKPPTTEAP